MSNASGVRECVLGAGRGGGGYAVMFLCVQKRLGVVVWLNGSGYFWFGGLDPRRFPL